MDRSQAWFDLTFKNEAACMVFLKKIRWTSKFRCPRCNGKTWYSKTRDVQICSTQECGAHLSIRDATIFNNSKLSLLIWFKIIFDFCKTEGPESAYKLHRKYKIGSYRSVLNLLAKIRSSIPDHKFWRVRGTLAIEKLEVPTGGQRHKLLFINYDVKNREIDTTEKPNGVRNDLIIFSEEHSNLRQLFSTKIFAGMNVEFKYYNLEPQEIPSTGIKLKQSRSNMVAAKEELTKFFNAYKGSEFKPELQVYLNEFIFRKHSFHKNGKRMNDKAKFLFLIKKITAGGPKRDQ